MSKVDAIFRHGVFEPLAAVSLPENQRVRVSVEFPTSDDVQQRLKDVQELHRRIVSRHGVLPDSTLDIAADRMR